MDRRSFFGSGAVALAGLGAAARAAPPEPRIRRYVPLGRTGMSISDISFGSSRLSDAPLVAHAFDRGVNYFDSAESYRFGDAEEAIGKALVGKRDQVYLTSKTRAHAGATRRQMMTALEATLRRLRTDYVDVYFNHAVNDVQRMKSTEWQEFTEAAKRDGKIRFRGMSGHGGNLVECLDYAIDNDLVDVILTAFNFAQDPDFYDKLRSTFHFVALQPDLPRVLAKAKAKGIGTVAMKTLMGARLNDMRRYEHDGATFAQAAFRWVLSHRSVDALVISMTGKAEIDEYVAASGDPAVGAADVRLLARYAALQGPLYCQHGCNACEESCPAGVPISEVLRTRMYDVDYGDRLMARSDYRRLAGASACATCAGAPCLDACPNGIPVAVFARDAASRLA